MILDDTLTRILNTIKADVKEKFNKDYSIEELNEIVDSQIDATKLGFIKGVTVHWTRFCKFVYTNRYNRKMDTIKKLNLIGENTNLSPLEKIKQRKEVIIESYIEKDKLSTKRGVGGKASGKSVDEVLSIPANTNNQVKVFKFLGNNRQ